MRQIEIGAGDRTAQPLLHLRLIVGSVFGSHLGRELGILAQGQDLFLHGRIGDHHMAIGIGSDLGRQRAIAVFGAVILEHRQPGLFDELIEAMGRTGGGLGIGIETAFARRLGHQIGEIHAGRGTGILDTGHDLGLDAVIGRRHRIAATAGCRGIHLGGSGQAVAGDRFVGELAGAGHQGL